MKVAIMQPYFLPYIGYLQLLNSVDKFILYDDIEYTKKGWINRNRIVDGEIITLPLKKDSDYLNVVERRLSDDWSKQKTKILNKIESRYRKAEYFTTGYKLFFNIINYEDTNLFYFIHNSINEVKRFLEIDTEIIVSSTLTRPQLQMQDSVIDLCKRVGGTSYVNPIGGKMLYDKNLFSDNELSLSFLRNTYNNTLSILDIIMTTPKSEIKERLLYDYEME